MEWASHVARVREERNVYIFVGKPEGKRPLGRPRDRWEDIVRMNLREIGWEGVKWIHVAQDRDEITFCWNLICYEFELLSTPVGTGCIVK